MKRFLPIGPFVAAIALAAAGSSTTQSGWRTDPAWHQGKAEWALYDAVRPIYGRPRAYEATIFTNKQRMDPGTTTKVAGSRSLGAVEVFKHNVSEMIPTENYTYRFLTTCFVTTDELVPVKVVFSSQEDCGATYREFVLEGATIRADQSCYFPDAGRETTQFRRPGNLAFHDALSLTLRDYPFDAGDKPVLHLDLVPDQTDTHETGLAPGKATARYVDRTTLDLPYGSVDAHHLQVDHPRVGGATRSDFWFAADPALRNVMVRYEGPWGVRYELKNLGWWAYWDRSAPRPAPRSAR